MARNNAQRAAMRSERVSDREAQETRDSVIVPLDQMNRAERRKYERAARRGKAPLVAVKRKALPEDEAGGGEG
jgi:hypothetical protein